MLPLGCVVQANRRLVIGKRSIPLAVYRYACIDEAISSWRKTVCSTLGYFTERGT